MKRNYIGVIRKLDAVGRISIVKEYSDYLNINKQDKLYIHNVGNDIHISNRILDTDALFDMRKLDQLNRLVIPSSLRRSRDLEVGAKYEQLLTDDRIIIKKFI